MILSIGKSFDFFLVIGIVNTKKKQTCRIDRKSILVEIDLSSNRMEWKSVQLFIELHVVDGDKMNFRRLSDKIKKAKH